MGALGRSICTLLLVKTELAAFTSFTALKQLRRVRSRTRLSFGRRVAGNAALLGTRRGEWDGPSLRSATNGLAARGLELALAESQTQARARAQLQREKDPELTPSKLNRKLEVPRT